jgi:hypothetical protein
LQQAGYAIRGQNRLTVEQNHVAPNTEGLFLRGNRTSDCSGFAESTGASHEGRGGYDALSLGFDNGAIYARGQSKVISVNDEPAHGFSLARLDVAGRKRFSIERAKARLQATRF